MYSFSNVLSIIDRYPEANAKQLFPLIRRALEPGPLRSKENFFVHRIFACSLQDPERMQYLQHPDYINQLEHWHQARLGAKRWCRICTSGKVAIYGILKMPENQCCSLRCSAIWQGSTEYQELRKAQIAQRYGGGFDPSHSPEARAKRKRTSMQKYGTSHPSQNAEVKARKAATNQRKYGKSCVLLNKKVQDKTKQTLQKAGVQHPQQMPGTQEKRERTFLARYGVTCPSKSADAKRKTQATCMERYGVPYAQQDPDVQRKAQISRIARKQYTTREGKVLRLQGCEPQVAGWLERNGCILDSAVDRKIRIAYPCVTKQRTRFYFPDFCVLTPAGQRHLVEAKGSYWALQPNVPAKYRSAQLACEHRGWNDYVLVVWDKRLQFKGREGYKELLRWIRSQT